MIFLLKLNVLHLHYMYFIIKLRYLHLKDLGVRCPSLRNRVILYWPSDWLMEALIGG